MRRNQDSRKAAGEILINHKGKRIPTSVGSLRYEASYSGSTPPTADGAYISGNIPEGYNHRPDLISNLFLGGPATWWVICERNSIFDVFEQLKSGDALYIPSRL